jgi:hypothetical protein
VAIVPPAEVQNIPTCGGEICTPAPSETHIFSGEKKTRGEKVESFATGRKIQQGYKGSPADKLRRKIARYKRLAASDQLGEKGRRTLVLMEEKFNKMKGKKTA